MSSPFKAVLAATLLLSLAGSQANAHTKLVASVPAAKAIIAPPAIVTLTFNERLVQPFRLSTSPEAVTARSAVAPVTTTRASKSPAPAPAFSFE